MELKKNVLVAETQLDAETQQFGTTVDA